LAAAVAELSGGLEQDQAAIRVGGVHAPPQGVADQGAEVLPGVVPEQRQPQPTLALERAVASPAVAPVPGQQTGHLAVEVDFLVHAAVGEADRFRAAGGDCQDKSNQDKGEATTHDQLLVPRWQSRDFWSAVA